MRGKIIDTIYERMETDPDVFFLTADMGINLVEKFENNFPDRFCNVGIAEQNLVGVSAGLVNIGFRPFAYTISNFMVHRCFEQVRNDVGLHNYPITLMGTSAGFDNAPLGPTHHVIDDWGSLRTIPEIDIYCPSTIPYSNTLIERILEQNRPAYIRIPKGDFLEPGSEEHFLAIMGRDTNVALASYGGIVQNCLKASRLNDTLSVLVFNRLRPLDESAVCGALSEFKRVIVVEDHFPSAGLYSVLCELVARNKLPCEVEFRAPTSYNTVVGTSPDFYHRQYGMDATSLAKIAKPR